MPKLSRPQIDLLIARLIHRQPNGDVGILAQSPEAQRLKQVDGEPAAAEYVQQLAQQAVQMTSKPAKQKTAGR